VNLATPCVVIRKTVTAQARLGQGESKSPVNPQRELGFQILARCSGRGKIVWGQWRGKNFFCRRKV